MDMQEIIELFKKMHKNTKEFCNSRDAYWKGREIALREVIGILEDNIEQQSIDKGE